MKPVIFLLAFLLPSFCGSCTPSGDDGAAETTQPPGDNGGGNGTGSGTNEGNMKINIKIGSAVFTATLADNTAAREFKAMLPITLDMSDYNSNEKVASLGKSLTVSSSNPGTIHTGDLMLWQSSSVVLFYKTFTTSYSYTRLGAIDDISGLETALGSGSVTITFSEPDDRD